MTKNSIPDSPAKIAGVYTITCTANERVYVGSSVNVKYRFKRHIWELNNGTHGNRHLLRAWAKYGAGAFVFAVVETVPDKRLLIEREQYWIDNLNSAKHGFNLSPNAGSTLGVKLSKEVRKKRGDAQRGIPRSEETKRKLSEANRGKRPSDEAFKKRVEAMRDETRSKEWRKNLSEALLRLTHGPKGDEYKRKLSDAHKGNRVSEETRRKLSLANKGNNAGEKNGRARLKESQVAVIKHRLLKGDMVRDIARDYNVGDTTISLIKSGKNWKHVHPITE